MDKLSPTTNLNRNPRHAGPGTAATTTVETGAGDVDVPKLCRGCQTRMPHVCDACRQKTPAYCGQCRRTIPAHGGGPGIPTSGLPRLHPGELDTLVERVMREQLLPTFAGITGWTGGRVAVHLPGRSPGAIVHAMRKFAADGRAQLIGGDPERYQLTAGQ